jgi:hypothetical protein
MRRGVHYSISDMHGSRLVGGGRFEVPERFTIRADDPDLPCVVELHIDNTGTEPACAEVRVTGRPGGPAVNGAMLRAVRVGEYLREGADCAVMKVHTGTTGRTVTVWPVPDEEEAASRRARRREKQPNRRITDDELARVADVYREALSVKKPPTAEVQQRLRLKSRAQAARWVSKARKAGFLGPALEWRRAGEALPEEQAENLEPPQGGTRHQESPRRSPPGDEAHVFTQPIPKRQPTDTQPRTTRRQRRPRKTEGGR